MATSVHPCSVVYKIFSQIDFMEITQSVFKNSVNIMLIHSISNVCYLCVTVACNTDNISWVLSETHPFKIFQLM